MSEWYEDDSFWLTFRDYMFSTVRIEQTRAEVDNLIPLLQIAPGAHLLDLCCGIGRHSLEFTRRGFGVTGVDRTAAYLKQARATASKEGLQIEFFQSDMRQFLRSDSFDGAISVFTSFGFFENPAEDLRVARNVCSSLRAGARFVVDINGKEVLAAKFRERDWNRRPDGSIVIEERRVLDGWSKIESRWIHIGGSARKESTLVIRPYSGVELTSMLKEAGFREVATYGSLSGTPYDHRAERLVAVAMK
jgi:SAM-dependent methyltransferase